MNRVLTAVVLIPLVLLVVFRAPWWVLALFIAFVAVLTAREYLAVIRGYGIEPFAWVVYSAVILSIAAGVIGILFGSFLIEGGWSIPLLLSLACAAPVVLRKNMQSALPAAAASAFAVIYIAFPLALVAPLRFHDPDILIFVVFSVWAGDTAAYYVGSSLGRHKLAPSVSPKKSWEGAAASLLASVAVAFLVFKFHAFFARFLLGEGPSLSGATEPVSWKVAAPLGIITNVAAQLGDLFESALKRGAQIKDSGSILPGHGGLLDRIDALLFAIPVAWYYASITRLVISYF
jgi:phosphatidate cytidylyltransferase